MRLLRPVLVLCRLLRLARPARPPVEPVGDAAAPSSDEPFDPAAYLALYPDVVRAELDPLDHYRQYGRKEGRSNGIVAHSRWGGGPLFDLQEGGVPFDGAKRSCLLVVHNSSRTGCPINTWSMLCELNKTHNVLTLSLHGGPLDGLFRAQSTA